MSSFQLNQSDVITIGKHELVFNLKDEIVNNHYDFPVSSEPSAEKTRFLDTFSHRGLLMKFASNSHKATLVTLQFKGKRLNEVLSAW